MKAISVRAPWWYFILHAGKDVENRDWPTRYRGTVLIHASKWWSDDAVDIAWDIAEDNINQPIIPPDNVDIKQIRGCIVGKVDIVDCVRKSASPWFVGEYGFVLANPVAFSQPIPFKGALGFFDVPDSLISRTPQAPPEVKHGMD